jgi:hypothetical protein
MQRLCAGISVPCFETWFFFFVWGQIKFHFHHVSLHDLTGLVLFSSGIICPGQRCANFIDGGSHFSIRCPLWASIGVHKSQAPDRLNFVRWCVMCCGSSVWNLLRVTYLAPRVLKLLLDFGEICAPLAWYTPRLLQPPSQFVNICRSINCSYRSVSTFHIDYEKRSLCCVGK